MLCEKCGKNNATTHIRTVVNGVVTEKNLCGYCAAEEGYNGLSHKGLAQMLASMFDDSATKILNNSVRCSCCNSTFADIASKGKVGCPECYKTFYDELLPYLKRVHGGTKHSGKIPNRAPLAIKSEEDTIGELRMKLNKLVKNEMFEEAAIIRDKIRKIEEE